MKGFPRIARGTTGKGQTNSFHYLPVQGIGTKLLFIPGIFLHKKRIVGGFLQKLTLYKWKKFETVQEFHNTHFPGITFQDFHNLF